MRWMSGMFGQRIHIRIRMRFLSLILTLASGILSCDDDPSSTMQVSLQADRSLWEGLSMDVRAGSFRKRLGIEDFDRRSFKTGFEVPESGNLVLTVLLQDAEGMIAEGEIVIPAREGFRWTVVLLRQNQNWLCSSCMEAAAFPIIGENQRFPGEALWITWSGFPSTAELPPF